MLPLSWPIRLCPPLVVPLVPPAVWKSGLLLPTAVLFAMIELVNCWLPPLEIEMPPPSATSAAAVLPTTVQLRMLRPEEVLTQMMPPPAATLVVPGYGIPTTLLPVTVVLVIVRAPCQLAIPPPRPLAASGNDRPGINSKSDP